jgi:hypothetical protein
MTIDELWTDIPNHPAATAAPPPRSLRALATNSALRYLLNASRPSERGELQKTTNSHSGRDTKKILATLKSHNGRDTKKILATLKSHNGRDTKKIPLNGGVARKRRGGFTINPTAISQ